MGRSKIGILLDDHLQSRDWDTLAPAQGLKGQSRSHRPTPPLPYPKSHAQKRNNDQSNHAEAVCAFMRCELGNHRAQDDTTDESSNMRCIVDSAKVSTEENVVANPEQNVEPDEERQTPERRPDGNAGHRELS